MGTSGGAGPNDTLLSTLKRQSGGATAAPGNQFARIAAHDGSVNGPTSTLGVVNGVGTPQVATAGNLLIVIGVGTGVTGPPAGFTQIGPTVSQVPLVMRMFAKSAVGGESAFTVAGGSVSGSACCEYSGSQNPFVLDGVPLGTSGALVSSLNTGAITTTNPNDLIFTACLNALGTSPSWSIATLVLSGDDFHDGLYAGQNIVTAPQTGYFDTAHMGAPGIMGTIIAAFESA